MGKANLLAVWGTTVFVIAVIVLSGQPQAVSAGVFSVPGGGVTCHRLQESEDALQLIIGDGGFEPTQVTKRPGMFMLSADDRRSDKTQRLTLRLSRENGELLREIEVPAGAIDWAEGIDLPAGKYVLVVVGRPDWTCRIEINPS